MLKKQLAVVTMALTMALSGGLAGCQWMGEKTGQAADEIEEGADEFEEGYEKGRQPD